MRPSPSSRAFWTIAGAAVGFLGVLAVAVYAVVDEVYIGCGPFVVEGRTLGGRCHDLSYAVSMVLWPLFVFGALAAAVGSLAGLAIGLAVRRLLKSS
jgi:hypothetical protein